MKESNNFARKCLIEESYVKKCQRLGHDAHIDLPAVQIAFVGDVSCLPRQKIIQNIVVLID